MTDISMILGGRQYTLSCAPGEETQLRRLGSMVDDKLAQVRTQAGDTSETRALLFTCLLLADELSELQNAALSLQQEAPAPAPPVSPTPDHSRAIGHLAARLEKLADDLEKLAPKA